MVVEKRTFRPDSAAVTSNVSLAAGWKSSESPIITHYYTMNGRYVGPTLTVCENDFLVVDVENRIPGESISLHWTGQSQRRTPFMDGVPMITQCPIASFTRFQYRFQADKAGTHLYHGFTGSERTQVRQCQHWLELEDHDLQILTLDGNGLEHDSMPSVSRILLHDGVRMDLTFIQRVPADVDNIERDYEIRFTPLEANREGCERAIFHLHYDSHRHGLWDHQLHTTSVSADGAESIKYNLIASPVVRPPSKALDLVGNVCGETVLCPQDLPGAREHFPKDLATYDTRLEFTISKRALDGVGPFGDPTTETVHSVNGFTFAFPSVLMVREPANEELRAHTCGGHRRTLPRSCHPLTVRCECVHVEHIEAGHRVEMVLINAG
uniref:Plastocyanin-like domain-containing protein n=1 Tax=Anopheles maculatus TaxID=74869 RepID=A0A182SW47_9DIPT